MSFRLHQPESLRYQREVVRLLNLTTSCAKMVNLMYRLSPKFSPLWMIPSIWVFFLKSQFWLLAMDLRVVISIMSAFHSYCLRLPRRTQRSNPTTMEHSREDCRSDGNELSIFTKHHAISPVAKLAVVALGRTRYVGSQKRLDRKQPGK
jgi:hypothetical protein